MSLGAKGKVLALCCNGLGFIYSKRKKMYDKAIEYYTRAIEAKDDNSYYIYCRGHAYEDMHDFEQAVVDYSRAIKMHPKKNYYTARANVYKRLGMKEESKKDL